MINCRTDSRESIKFFMLRLGCWVWLERARQRLARCWKILFADFSTRAADFCGHTQIWWLFCIFLFRFPKQKIQLSWLSGQWGNKWLRKKWRNSKLEFFTSKLCLLRSIRAVLSTANPAAFISRSVAILHGIVERYLLEVYPNVLIKNLLQPLIGL